MLSFNNPFGACEDCSGLGVTLEFDPALVAPGMNLSFNDGGIAPYNPKANWHRSQFESLAKHFKFKLDTPLKDLPEGLSTSSCTARRKRSFPLREQGRAWEVGVPIGIPRSSQRSEADATSRAAQSR